MADVQLVIVDGAGSGREFDVSGAIVAGRDPEAGIALEDAEASRRHASFSAEGDTLTVEDLGSTNGTFVNEERITGARTFDAGDRVRIGTTVFEVRSPVGAAQAAPPPSGPPAAGPPPPPSFPPPGGPGEPPPPQQPPSGFPPPQQPGGYAQPGQPPAPHGQAALATGDYPIDFQADYPHGGIARWRPFLQGAWFAVLALPHFIVLTFVWIAAFIAWFVAFFAILITGRYPRGLFDFLAGTERWTYRVVGYTYLLTEEYPPFSLGEEPDYPIRVRIDYPEQGIARWRPLVHWLLSIPHYIVLYFLGIGAFFAYIAVWFAIVFTREYPPGLFNFMVGFHRWQARYAAYVLWMTEEYPPFSLS